LVPLEDDEDAKEEKEPVMKASMTDGDVDASWRYQGMKAVAAIEAQKRQDISCCWGLKSVEHVQV